MLRLEPIGEKNDVSDAKSNRDDDEYPTLFIHKLMNTVVS